MSPTTGREERVKITEWLLSQLDVEGPRTRRAVERVPEGRDDWKPHEKSMTLGQLTTLVASMTSWLAMIVNQDSLDLNPPGGARYRPPMVRTREERLQAVDAAMADARKALSGTTDEHLMTPWRLLVSGQVVNEEKRYVVLRDTFMHLAHHRGQLTVYLRLQDAPVPAIYGPSADDSTFA